MKARRLTDREWMLVSGGVLLIACAISDLVGRIFNR